jgi:hypothetical protein
MSIVLPQSLSDISSVSLDSKIAEFRALFEYIYREKENLENLSKSGNILQSPIMQDKLSLFTQHFSNLDDLLRTLLQDLLQCPPCHLRHRDMLSLFHRIAPYEKSVFIMTKFPEGNSKSDKELNKVIRAVSSAIKNCGFSPRVASQKDYHKLLWDNVELHLLGCGKGVAILEDRYKPELNPNVAMEWGWMRAMGKDVLCLVEDGFKHYRADVSGLIEYNFSWEKPANGTRNAIKKWLEERTTSLNGLA